MQKSVENAMKVEIIALLLNLPTFISEFMSAIDKKHNNDGTLCSSVGASNCLKMLSPAAYNSFNSYI